MSIVSSDLIAYCSASRPTDDVSTTGGAIDALYRPVFTQMSANSTLEVVSSAVGDTTQVVTLIGRDAGGVYSTSTATLNGTTAVAFSPATTFERILSVSMSATATGTVTVRNSSAGTTWGTIPIGEKGFFAMFINAASSASGSTTRYEKFFWKNTNGTLTLTSSQVTLTADSVGDLNMGLATTIDDTATVANRTSAPAGVSFVGLSTAQNVPNSGNLTNGSGIGVWMKLSLATNASPIRNTFTTQLSGNTV